MSLLQRWDQVQRAAGEAAVPLCSESLALLFEASDQQQTSPTLKPRGFLSPSPCWALLCSKLQCFGWLGLTVRWAQELAFSDRTADSDRKGAAGTAGPSGHPREEEQPTPGTKRLKAAPQDPASREGKPWWERSWMAAWGSRPLSPEGPGAPCPRDGEVVPARQEPTRSAALTPRSWAPERGGRGSGVRAGPAPSPSSPCSGSPRPR